MSIDEKSESFLQRILNGTTSFIQGLQDKLEEREADKTNKSNRKAYAKSCSRNADDSKDPPILKIRLKYLGAGTISEKSDSKADMAPHILETYDLLKDDFDEMKKDGYQHSTVWFLVFWNKICITDKRIGVVLKTIDFECITWCGINNNRSNIVGIIADLYTHLPDNLATKSTQRNNSNSATLRNQKMAAQRLASTSPIAFNNHNIPENLSNSTLSLNTKQYNQTQNNTQYNHNFNNQNSTSLNNNQHNLNNQYNSSSTPRSRINNKKQTFSNNSGSLNYSQHQSSLVQSQHLSSSTPNIIEKRRNLSVCFLLKFNGRNDGNTILRTLKKQLAEYHARKNESELEVTSSSRSTIAKTLHNTVNVSEIKKSASQVKLAEIAKIHALNALDAQNLLESQNTHRFEPSSHQPVVNSNFNPMFAISSPSTINNKVLCPTPQIHISGPSTTASKTTIQHPSSLDQSSSIVENHSQHSQHSQHSSQNLMLHEQIMSLSSVVSDLQKEIANLRQNKTVSQQSTSQDGGVSQTSEYHEVSPPNSQNTSQHSEVARAEAFLAQNSVGNQDRVINSSADKYNITDTSECEKSSFVKDQSTKSGNNVYFQLNSPFEILTSDHAEDTEDAEIKTILKHRMHEMHQDF